MKQLHTKKVRRLTVRLTLDEYNALIALAESDGVSLSEAFGRVVRQASPRTRQTMPCLSTLAQQFLDTIVRDTGHAAHEVLDILICHYMLDSGFRIPRIARHEEETV